MGKIWSMIYLWLLLQARFAMGYGVSEDDSFGTMAIRSQKKSHLWTFLDTSIIDGRIRTIPPDETIYDRRLDSKLNVGGEGFWANRFGLRLNVAFSAEKRRIAGKDPAGPVTDQVSLRYQPSSDFTFVTDKGLEIILGMIADIYGREVENESHTAGQTKTSFSNAKVLGKRFGIVRRGGKWNGGFGYTQGGNSSRSKHSDVFDGSISDVNETIFIPSRIDMFADGNAGSARMRINLGFIQARGLGPTDTRGSTIYTDHFEALVGGGMNLGSQLLDFSVAHRTYSYGSSAFVSMDSIPVSSLTVRIYQGTPEDGAFLGIRGLSAKDGQSLPEFNAKYQVIGYGLNMGFCRSL